MELGVGLDPCGSLPTQGVSAIYVGRIYTHYCVASVLEQFKFQTISLLLNLQVLTIKFCLIWNYVQGNHEINK